MSPLDSISVLGIDTGFRHVDIQRTPKAEPTADLVSALMDKLREAEERLAEQRERIAYLETLSLTDELTGLLNRRGFAEAFKRTLASARRTGTGGVLVMIDLDGFKAINDTHGHLAGDQYLRRVAKVLSENVRAKDVVGRLGGDEFAVLLTDAEGEIGLTRAAALADALNAETCRVGACVLPLRASFGAETYRPDDSEDDVTRRADMLMYRTKAARKRAA